MHTTRPRWPSIGEKYPYFEVVDKIFRDPSIHDTQYLANGITSVLDVGGFYWYFEHLLHVTTTI